MPRGNPHQTIGFKVSPDVKQRLEDLAYQRRVKVSDIMRALVDRHLREIQEDEL